MVAAASETNRTAMADHPHLVVVMEDHRKALLVAVTEEDIAVTSNEKVQAGMTIETRSALGISSFSG